MSDPYPQYAMLAGRSGGQIFFGGTAAGEQLVLQGTGNNTPGPIFLNPNGGGVAIGGSGPDNNLLRVTGTIGGQGRAAVLASPTQGDVGGTQYGLLAQSAGKSGGGAANFMAIGIHGGTLDNYKASLWVSPDQQRPGLNIGFAGSVTAPVFGAIFNGNVGIGNAAPRTLLDVGTSSAAFAASATDTRLYVSRAGVANAVVRNNSDNVEMLVRAGADAGAVGTVSNHPLALWTNNAERVRIAEGGNVGIGNANPGAALDVSGRIRVRDNASDTTWANPLQLAIKTAPGGGALGTSFHAENGARLAALGVSGSGVTLSHPGGGWLILSTGSSVTETHLEVRPDKTGINMDYDSGPLFPLHVRDDTVTSGSGMLFTTVVFQSSPVVIIPDQPGGIVNQMWAGIVWLQSTDGAFALAQLIWVPKGGTWVINLDGSNQIAFSAPSSGYELIAERTLGTKTYEAILLGIWR